MEEVIISAGERLSDRIQEERVRQMLFLSPDQHIALHFKVAKDHELFFMYGSVISEKEAIQQTRPQLLMGDPAMTDELVGSALLRGGTEKKALPYIAPQFEKTRLDVLNPSICEDATTVCAPSLPAEDEDVVELGQCQSTARSVVKCRPEGVRLPPISDSRGVAEETCAPLFGDRSRRRQADFSVIPRVSYPRPEIPDAPFTIKAGRLYLSEEMPRSVQDRKERERTRPLSCRTRTSERPFSARSPTESNH
jgi:hypothetical protein